MSAIDTLKDAIAGIIADWPVIRQFANGGATDTVDTDAGTIPVIAKIAADANAMFEQAKTDLIAQKGAEIDQAGTGLLAQAQAAADAAEASETASASSSSTASTAAGTAQAAANAASVAGRYFATEAAGLAGSADGQVFSAPSADGHFLVVYLRQAGAAVEQIRFATQAYLDSGLDFSSYWARSGYAGVVMDSLRRIVIGVRPDSTVDVGHVRDIGGKVTQAMSIAAGPATGASSVVATAGGDARTNPRLTTDVAALESAAANVMFRQERVAYAWPWTDAQDHVTGGLDRAGNLWSKGFNVTGIVAAINALGIASLTAAAGVAANVSSSSAWPRSGYSMPWLDREGHLAGGLASNGDLMSKGMNVTQAIRGLGTNGAAVAALQTAVYSSSDITCWGDSLTAGAGGTTGGYPPMLATLLNRRVNKRAVGGQSTSDTMTRQGGFSTLLTVQGNVIPASGPVNCTAWTRTPITSQGPGPIHGSLYGVPGTLSGTFDANGSITSYVFTRDTPGDDTPIDPQTPFIVDLGNEYDVTVFWVGRNDYPTGVSDFATAAGNVKNGLAAGIATLAAAEKKFVILGVTNSDKATEYKGAPVYNAIVQLNADLKAMYPRNFIDIRTILVRHYDPDNPQDVIDFGNDIPPSSLRFDPTHLVDAGYAIVAKAVADFITLRGW